MESKILIVDDNSEFRKALVLYLQKELSAIEIIEAETGEEGVNQAIKQNPYIILMDIKLPQMDGIEAAEKIKKVMPHCMIIVLSLFADDMKTQNNVSDAIDEVIGKNEIETQLLPLLRKCLLHFIRMI